MTQFYFDDLKSAINTIFHFTARIDPSNVSTMPPALRLTTYDSQLVFPSLNTSFRTHAQSHWTCRCLGSKLNDIKMNFQPHHCKFCRHCFDDFAKYQRHIQRHQKWNRYYNFSHTGNSSRERIHTKEKSYQYYYCRKSFSECSGKTVHERIHQTKEKPYQSKYCNKSSSGKIERIHHTKEKPHQCAYCNMGFSQLSSKTKHERIHTKEKPFQCIYCHKRFTDSSGKIVHERIHTKEKPYQCKYCNKGFSDASGKTVHERIHTKEKPYQCVYCSKCFSQLSSKIKHERIHTKERPYQCAYCSKSFSQLSNKTRHEKACSYQGQ